MLIFNFTRAYFLRIKFIFFWLYYSFLFGKLIKFRKGTSDISVFKQIFIKKEYDVNLTFKPKIMIDAGANVGYASIWFAIKYPGIKIFAIEPEKSNFEILKKIYLILMILFY